MPLDIEVVEETALGDAQVDQAGVTFEDAEHVSLWYGYSRVRRSSVSRCSSSIRLLASCELSNSTIVSPCRTFEPSSASQRTVTGQMPALGTVKRIDSSAMISPHKCPLYMAGLRVRPFLGPAARQNSQDAPGCWRQAAMPSTVSR